MAAKPGDGPAEDVKQEIGEQWQVHAPGRCWRGVPQPAGPLEVESAEPVVGVRRRSDGGLYGPVNYGGHGKTRPVPRIVD